jgi:hypothetical protein
MAGETSLLSKHFSSHEPVEQVTARPPEKMFSLQVTRFLDLKGNWILRKIMLQKEILKFFHHCWGLRVKKDITKS